MGSLDYHKTLREVATMAVPDVADWSVVDILEDDRLVRLTLHAEPVPSHPGLVRSGEVPRNPFAGQVLDTGTSVILPRLDADHLRQAGRDPEKETWLRDLVGGSCIIVPLGEAPKVLGVLTLVRNRGREAFTDEDGSAAEEIGRVAGAAIDRARQHARVVSNRDQLETILQAIDNGILLMDARGQIIFANQASAVLAGTGTGARMLGRHANELMEGVTTRDAYGRTVGLDDLPGPQALRGKTTQSRLLHFTNDADPKGRWVVISAWPLRGQSGAIESAVVVVRDVTEQHQAFEAKARLAAIIDSSDDAIVSKDLTGRIQSWNNGAQALFGYTPEETVGRSIKMLIPPELQSEEDMILGKISRGEHVDHYETRRVRKDGRMVDVSLTISPIRDATGRIIGASKIARNITERKRAHEALRTLNQELEYRVRERTYELEAAVRDLEAFNYTVSHDLRTPLRAITGFAKLLLADVNVPSQRESLQYILDGATEMTRITETLLRLSRIKHDDLRRSRVDITRLAHEVAVRLQRENTGRKVEFEVEPGLEVEADPGLVSVVLENLIGNAWKFTAKNPDAKIRVGRRLRNGRSVFFVQDNGVGFSAAEASQLFQPFRRLRPLEFEGNGIGLATAHRIVRAHGGGIEAEGQAGVGATIFFWFEGSPVGGLGMPTLTGAPHNAGADRRRVWE